MDYDGINTSPSERNDTLTQLILDWDKNSESNPYMTIEEVINEWEHDIETRDDLTERELGDIIYEKFNFEWNDGYKRGKSFLIHNDINYEIINAIEDLYIYTEWEQGDYLHKTTLEDKLDIIYYFKAQEALKATTEEHEIYPLNWN